MGSRATTRSALEQLAEGLTPPRMHDTPRICREDDRLVDGQMCERGRWTFQTSGIGLECSRPFLARPGRKDRRKTLAADWAPTDLPAQQDTAHPFSPVSVVFIKAGWTGRGA
jgi:hypothetical protein